MEQIVFNLLDSFVEILLPTPDHFLIIKESLTRIGVASRNSKTLWQSCHIFHKRGRWYITHFKEMLALDGKQNNITQEDIARRNTIVNLLEQWELLEIIDPSKTDRPTVDISEIDIISFEDKKNWNLQYKYRIGKVRRKE